MSADLSKMDQWVLSELDKRPYIPHLVLTRYQRTAMQRLKDAELASHFVGLNGVNYVITDAGRKALEGADNGL